MTVKPSTTNDSAQQAEFVQIIGGFADAVTSNFKQPISAQPEDQVKASPY